MGLDLGIFLTYAGAIILNFHIWKAVSVAA